MTPEENLELARIALEINRVTHHCHFAALKAGWWHDLETGDDLRGRRNVGELLCLVHSEISEAMEGARKGLMDDKLPHRSMFEVELADALIQAGTTPDAAKIATWNYLVERDEKTPIDSTPPPARPKAVRRAEFNALSPRQQHETVLAGIRIID
jgi:hypothetical protein